MSEAPRDKVAEEMLQAARFSGITADSYTPEQVCDPDPANPPAQRAQPLHRRRRRGRPAPQRRAYLALLAMSRVRDDPASHPLPWGQLPLPLPLPCG
jgi:hypothetical protein